MFNSTFGSRSAVLPMAAMVVVVAGSALPAWAQPKPRVAIVAAAAASATAVQFTDPRAKLVASGFFDQVDIINASTVTPTLAELQAYQAVMVWSNVNFLDPAALGNVLADYADAGGGVVVTVFANSTTTANRSLTGRWLTDGYEIIPGRSGNKPGRATLGAVALPAHPIMAGVTTFDGGTSSFRPTTTLLTSHGVKVAEWSDGSTLAATSTRFPRRADLGFYPPSSAASASFWVESTDGGKLLANTLLFAAAPASPPPPPACRANCSGDTDPTTGRPVLDVQDFTCFQNAFALGDLAKADVGGATDCAPDGTLSITDFTCFQNLFALGCP